MTNDNFKPTVDLRQNTQPKPEQPRQYTPGNNPPRQHTPRPSTSSGHPSQEGMATPPREGNSSPRPKTSPQPPARNARASEAGGAPYKGEGGMRDERSDPSSRKALPREILAGTKDEQQKIDRPPAAKVSEQSKDYLKIIFSAIALLAIIGSGYFFWYKQRQAVKNVPQAKWYMVKLTNSETFYGQIKNTSGDPVVIDNVYYDYDQLNKKEADPAAAAGTEQTGSIRLVKRGKETHGPSGSLDVVRLQVLYMEPLADDSKVLKAIVEYEKGK